MTNTSIAALYGTLLATSLELDKQIAEKLDKRGFLPDTLVNNLAEVHAEKYDCFFVLQETGWKFYTSEEAISANRHEAAQKQWNRCIAKFHNITKSKRGGARKTEAKPTWQKLGDAFNELSRTEKNAFLKYVGEK